VRLAQMGEFQMTESCIQLFGGRQVVHGGSWLHNCGDSLGLPVVFKCLRETGNAWGIMAECFWGLLRDNGCIQRFGGVGTGLLLCVFPLFTYHN
jgi:hypothetical protein